MQANFDCFYYYCLIQFNDKFIKYLPKMSMGAYYEILLVKEDSVLKKKAWTP
jgi:hypothetical protein